MTYPSSPAPAVYRCSLELMDYLFYATTERGKVFETGGFLHNYALTYALAAGGAFHLPRFSPRYGHEVQQPAYDRELQPLNDVHLYVTPARPVHLVYRLTQFNTMREGYALGGKARSIAYPDWGFLRLISPSSRFQFFVVTAADLTCCSYVRLGKFLSKARLSWEKADSVEQRQGDFSFEGYLNWLDIAEPKPVLFDVLPTSLPSRIVGNPQFVNAPYWAARFGKETVAIPMGLQYRPQVSKPARRKA